MFQEFAKCVLGKLQGQFKFRSIQHT